MNKFAILYNKGIWNHAIVGFDDGSYKLVKEFNAKNKKWHEGHINENIKVIRAEKFSGNSSDFAFYDSKEISRAPLPSLHEIKAFRENSTAFDIKFYADYIYEDNIWVVFDDKPDVNLSIHEI